MLLPMEARFPRALKRGDAVAVLSPSSPLKEDHHADLDQGIARLRSWGLRPRLMPHALDRVGYLAGSDKARAADLQSAFDDEELRAILCVRGGYGATRILGQLDPEALRKDPKPIVGFSDITALQAWAWAVANVVTVHGPNVVITKALEAGPDLEELERKLLFDGEHAPALPMPEGDNPHVLRTGRAEGRLMGGNLSLVTALMGTPWQVDPSGAILFLEDVGEDPYRVDRMLTQLRSGGLFANCAGIVLGDFHVEGTPRGSEDADMTNTLRSCLEDVACPVAHGFPFGHRPHSWSLPWGGRARLDASDEKATPTLTLLDSAVK